MLFEVGQTNSAAIDCISKMPPKKRESGSQDSSKLKVEKSQDDKIHENHGDDKKADKKDKTVPAKRKQPKDSQEGPEKAPRRSDRGKAKPSSLKVLKFLLSTEALDLCRPKDEKEDLADRGKIKTYSDSDLNPFEELLSAVVLSRPISHALGVRAIRTILNDPYNFSSPKAILDAGDEKVHQSLWDARTQHKDKTAAQLSLVAQVIPEKFSKGDTKDTSLEGVRKEAAKDMEKESDLLISSIKGLGKTGMSIFFRRIQWLWEECYPYVDERTGKALVELSLPSDAEELSKLVDENWKEIKDSIADRKDEKEEKRKTFVVLLERAIGAELEKSTAAVLKHVGRS